MHSAVTQETWAEIERLTNLHGYMSGVDRETERVKKTSEIYTPTALVIEIIQKMDISDFSPGKKVIDPSCGDGQFLVPSKWLKVLHFGMTEEAALDDIYGVDIMEDNVAVCIKRLGGGHIICDNMLDSQTETVKGWFEEPSLEGFFG